MVLRICQPFIRLFKAIVYWHTSQNITDWKKRGIFYPDAPLNIWHRFEDPYCQTVRFADNNLQMQMNEASLHALWYDNEHLSWRTNLSGTCVYTQ